MDFKIGDVVQLKSGGPAMTVLDVGKDAAKTVAVVWYAEEEEQFRRDSFPEICLDRIEYDDEDDLEDEEDEEDDE